MNKQQIKELALGNGFKLKEQPDGSMDLNPYVYDFAAALKAQWQADILAEISLQVSASKPVATPIQIATAIMKESNNIRNSAQEAGGGTHKCSKADVCKSTACSHAIPHEPKDCARPAPCGVWPGNPDFKPMVICLPK